MSEPNALSDTIEPVTPEQPRRTSSMRHKSSMACRARVTFDDEYSQSSRSSKRLTGSGLSNSSRDQTLAPSSQSRHGSLPLDQDSSIEEDGVLEQTQTTVPFARANTSFPKRPFVASTKAPKWVRVKTQDGMHYLLNRLNGEMYAISP
jgi:hypothetical protein